VAGQTRPLRAVVAVTGFRGRVVGGHDGLLRDGAARDGPRSPV
jgi:hypothetical protein